MVNRIHKIMLGVTILLVTLTVAAALFFAYMLQACSGCGTIGGIAFMIALVPTSICVPVTIGLWLFHRNSSVRERPSLLEPNSGNKN